MYDINPKPNSDEAICSNCEIVIGKDHITETVDGDSGCTECISYCQRCGKDHFIQDMYSSPWFGKICNDCISTDDYKKAVRNKILKSALRCYFDKIDHGRIENTIIEVAEIMGFTELAIEMRSDLSN